LLSRRRSDDERALDVVVGLLESEAARMVFVMEVVVDVVGMLAAGSVVALATLS
jgi:hypothetical protein